MLKRRISKQRLKEIIPTLNEKLINRIKIIRTYGTDYYTFEIGINKYLIQDEIDEDEMFEIVKEIKGFLTDLEENEFLYKRFMKVI